MRLAIVLGLASSAWGALVAVVPAFRQMFHETGVTLPITTEWLLAVSSAAETPLGWTLFAAGMVSIVVVDSRARSRSRRDVIASTSIAGFLVLFAGMVLVLFLPLTPGIQKL